MHTDCVEKAIDTWSLCVGGCLFILIVWGRLLIPGHYVWEVVDTY